MELTFFLLGYAVIGALCAVYSAVLAEARGHGPTLWLILGLLFGPITLLIAACLPNERKKRATVTAAELSAPISSVAVELTQLANLRDQGVLTDDEFAAQKAKLLG